MRTTWSRVALVGVVLGLAFTSWLGLRLVLADPAPSDAAPGSSADGSSAPAGERVSLGPGVSARTGTDGDTCQPGSYHEAVAAKAEFADEHLSDDLGASGFGVTAVGVSQRTDQRDPRSSFVVVATAVRAAPTTDRPSCSAGVQVLWMTGGPYYAS